MTREEQIRKAADDYCGDDTREQSPCFYAHIHNAFLEGVAWADSHPQWIPVEEELPKADGRYIIADKYGGVEQMNFDVESKYWWLRGTGKMSDFVTHWMLLPQPPRKEANNERQ